MTWLNWSLKFHPGLRTIPRLILTHNTQDFCSMNAYFFCVIVHVQMWCVYSIACRLNPKKNLSILYVFKSGFTLSCFEFLVQIAFFMFFIKNSFRGIFARSLWLSSSHKNGLKQKMKTQNSDRNFRDCLATVSRVKSSHEKFSTSEAFFANNFTRS